MSLPTLEYPLTLDDLPPLENKWHFVGIDLAPIDSLETGIVVIDRDRTILRMEKVEHDKEIFHFIENLGPKDGLIIALDIPKSLSFTSKWRQQQIKMHPLRFLHKDQDAFAHSRFSKRASDIYQHLSNKGFLIINFFSHYAKLRYGLNIPFRSRSPQGCRAMQALIKERLKIQPLSSHLAPSSVLDAMIGAYLAWSIYTYKRQLTRYEIRAERVANNQPQSNINFKASYKQPIIQLKKPVAPEQPFKLYRDHDFRLFVDPQQLLHVPKERRYRIQF